MASQANLAPISKDSESEWIVISENPLIEMLKQPEKEHIEATYLFRMPHSEKFKNPFAVEWIKRHVSSGPKDRRSKHRFRATNNEKALFSRFLYENWIRAHEFLNIPSSHASLLIFQRIHTNDALIMSTVNFTDPSQKSQIQNILERDPGQIFQMYTNSKLYQNFIEKVRASQKPDKIDHFIAASYFAHEKTHLQDNGKYSGYIQNTEEYLFLTEIRSYILNYLHPMALHMEPAAVVHQYSGKIKTRLARLIGKNSTISYLRLRLQQMLNPIARGLQNMKIRKALSTAKALKEQHPQWKEVAKISSAIAGIVDFYALLVIANEFSKVDKEFKESYEGKGDKIQFLLHPPTPEAAERLAKFAKQFATEVATMPLARILAKTQKSVKDILGYPFLAKDVKPQSYYAPSENSEIKNLFKSRS